MEVERRGNMSLAEFRMQYMRRSTPVVLENATSDWPAMGKWTPEFFAQQHGTKQVTINGKATRLGDFVEQVLQSTDDAPAPYLSNLLVARFFPEIMSDVRPGLRYALPHPASDWLMRKVGYDTGVDQVEFYLGGRGTRFSTLHFDNFYAHAFITQIYGDKDFILIPPEQTPFVYAGGQLPARHDAKTIELGTAVSYHSAIDDVFDPDLDRFPLFRNATPIHLSVSAPDTVFVPSGWWHATRMTSVSIAVSTNSVNSDNAKRAGKTFVFPKRRKQWRAIVDRCGRPLVRPAIATTEFLVTRADRSATG